MLFFDLSDPLNPVKLPTFIDRPGKTAGAVGIVRQANGKWLVMVGDGDNNNIDLYVEGGGLPPQFRSPNSKINF